jgi:hypothetical protein
MKSTVNIVVLFIYAFFYLSCAPHIIQIDYDKYVDFSKYKTYKLVKQKENKRKSIFEDDIIREKFTVAIERELSAKGYQFVTNTKADFKVVYHFIFKKKPDVGVYGYRYWPYYGIGEQNIQTKDYQEGSFIIDIIDRNEYQLVWRGSAEGVLKENEDVEKLIITLVREILKEFPPQ